VDAATLRRSVLRLAHGKQSERTATTGHAQLCACHGRCSDPAARKPRNLPTICKREAWFAAHEVFDKSRGVDTDIGGDVLALKQDSEARILWTKFSLSDGLVRPV
jgi:hypothetical protein